MGVYRLSRYAKVGTRAGQAMKPPPCARGRRAAAAAAARARTHTSHAPYTHCMLLIPRTESCAAFIKRTAAADLLLPAKLNIVLIC
jgi:uncharacterized protein involved in copper resistance